MKLRCLLFGHAWFEVGTPTLADEAGNVIDRGDPVRVCTRCGFIPGAEDMTLPGDEE